MEMKKADRFSKRRKKFLCRAVCCALVSVNFYLADAAAGQLTTSLWQDYEFAYGDSLAVQNNWFAISAYGAPVTITRGGMEDAGLSIRLTNNTDQNAAGIRAWSDAVDGVPRAATLHMNFNRLDLEAIGQGWTVGVLNDTSIASSDGVTKVTLGKDDGVAGLYTITARSSSADKITQGLNSGGDTDLLESTVITAVADHSEAQGVWIWDGGGTTIFHGNAEINATGKTAGVGIKNTKAVTLKDAATIRAKATGTGGSAFGVYNGVNGAGTTRFEGTSDIRAEGDAARGVYNYWGDVTFGGEARIAAEADQLSAIGVQTDTSCTVGFAKNAVITASSRANDVYAVDNAQNTTITWAGDASLTATTGGAANMYAVAARNNGGTLDFTDAAGIVSLVADGGADGVAYGLENKGLVQIAGDLTIAAGGSYAHGARNYGTASFDGTVQIDVAATNAQGHGIVNTGGDDATMVFGGETVIKTQIGSANANDTTNAVRAEAGTIAFGKKTELRAENKGAGGAVGMEIQAQPGLNVPRVTFDDAAEIEAESAGLSSSAVLNVGGVAAFRQDAALNAVGTKDAEAIGLWQQSGANTTFDGAADIRASQQGGLADAEHYAWGVLNKQGSKVVFAGASVKLTAETSGTNSRAFGLRNNGGQVEFGENTDAEIAVTSDGEAYGIVTGIVPGEIDTDYAHTVFKGSSNIQAVGAGTTAVWHESGKTYFYGATDIRSDANGVLKRGIGAQSDGGDLKFFGDTKITASSAEPDEAFALYAKSGNIEINHLNQKKKVELTGHLKAEAGGTITVVLDALGSELNGLVFADGGTVNLTLRSDGAWNPTGTSDAAIESLTLGARGTVDMTKFGKANGGAYRTLTIGQLSGANGIFKIATDLKNLTGDKLVFQAADDGKQYLLITDASMQDDGANYSREEFLEIARMESADGKALTLETIPVVKGEYQYKIVLQETMDGADKVWSFNDLGSDRAEIPDPGPDPDPDPDPIPPDPEPEQPPVPPVPPVNDVPGPDIPAPDTAASGVPITGDQALSGDHKVDSANGAAAVSAAANRSVAITVDAAGALLKTQNSSADRVASMTGIDAAAGGQVTIGGGNLTLLGTGDKASTGIRNSGGTVTVSPEGNLNVQVLLSDGRAVGIQNRGSTDIGRDVRVEAKSLGRDAVVYGMEQDGGVMRFGGSAEILAYGKGNVSGAGNAAGMMTFEREARIEATAVQGGEARGINNTRSAIDAQTKFQGETTILAKADKSAEGIHNENGSIVFEGKAAITAERTPNMTADGTVKGIANASGNVTFKGETAVTATGNHANVRGVFAQAGSVVFDQAARIQAKTTGISKMAYGVYAENTGKVTLSGATDIRAQGDPQGDVYALYARDQGEISVNADGGKSAKIVGNVAAVDGGRVALLLDNAQARFQGLIETKNGGKVDLTLKNGGTWNPTGTADVSIASLNLEQNGVVDMKLAGDSFARASAPASFRTLTMQNMTGNAGIFKLYTDLAEQKGDRLVFDSVQDGKQYLLITDVGMNADGNNVTSDTALEVARLKNEAGKTLELTTVPVTKGNWQYQIQLQQATDGGDRTWSFDDLNPVQGGVNVSYRDGDLTALESLENLFGVLMIENNELSRRLDDLRGGGTRGLWARVQAGEQEIGGRRTTESRYHAIQVGYDCEKTIADGRLYIGGAVGNVKASNSYEYGDGTAASTSVGLYGAWQGDGGHYADVALRHGWMDTSYTSNYFYYDQDTSDLIDRVNGEYKTQATSLSLEYGYKKKLENGWYFTPQAGFLLGHIGGGQFIDSTGRTMRADSVNSKLLRVGFQIGRDTGVPGRESSFYAKGSILHEFGGDIRLRAGNVGLNEDLGGTYYAFGIGLTSKVSDCSDLYFDLERTVSGKLSRPWGINAGVRYTF